MPNDGCPMLAASQVSKHLIRGMHLKGRVQVDVPNQTKDLLGSAAETGNCVLSRLERWCSCMNRPCCGWMPRMPPQDC